jgi:predicted ArsR family transcriptional regulator
MESARDQPRHLDGARVHRALSSPVRTRLLRLLLDAAAVGEGTGDDGGAVVGDVRALATALGLHVNTVRAHLAVLEGAGLVRSEPEARDRPGRPRLVYRPTDEATAVLEPSAVAGVSADLGYRSLAGVLARFVASTVERPADAATEAGIAWGRSLSGPPGTDRAAVDAEGAIRRVVTLLQEFGFEPERRDRDEGEVQLRLRRCPFHDVAMEQPDVVCSVHLGLLRGVLDELGADVEVRDLLPFVEPDLCVADLHVRGAGPET